MTIPNAYRDDYTTVLRQLMPDDTRLQAPTTRHSDVAPTVEQGVVSLDPSDPGTKMYAAVRSQKPERRSLLRRRWEACALGLAIIVAGGLDLGALADQADKKTVNHDTRVLSTQTSPNSTPTTATPQITAPLDFTNNAPDTEAPTTTIVQAKPTTTTLALTPESPITTAPTLTPSGTP